MGEQDSTVEDQIPKADGQSDRDAAYYAILGVDSTASATEIRQAYRELSKLYHPDTTTLPEAIAIAKFRQLKDAYSILSNPQKRLAYDISGGYRRSTIAQGSVPLPTHNDIQRHYTSSAYLDARDRPLSPGEVFALFIMGLSLVTCLVLAIVVGILRGDTVSYSLSSQSVPSPVVAKPDPASELTIVNP